MIFDQQNQTPDPGILTFPDFPFSNQADQGVGPGPVVVTSIIIEANNTTGNQIQGNVNGTE